MCLAANPETIARGDVSYFFFSFSVHQPVPIQSTHVKLIIRSTLLSLGGRKSAKTKRAVCEGTNSLNKMLCNNDLTLSWLSLRRVQTRADKVGFDL